MTFLTAQGPFAGLPPFDIKSCECAVTSDTGWAYRELDDVVAALRDDNRWATPVSGASTALRRSSAKLASRKEQRVSQVIGLTGDKDPSWVGLWSIMPCNR